MLWMCGCGIFWAGAFTPRGAGGWAFIPVREYLELVATHRVTWLWIATVFTVGGLLTVAGLSLLGTILRRHGGHLWSALGQVAFVLGSVLWLASLGFRALVPRRSLMRTSPAAM